MMIEDTTRNSVAASNELQRDFAGIEEILYELVDRYVVKQIEEGRDVSGFGLKQIKGQCYGVQKLPIYEDVFQLDDDLCRLLQIQAGGTVSVFYAAERPEYYRTGVPLKRIGMVISNFRRRRDLKKNKDDLRAGMPAQLLKG